MFIERVLNSLKVKPIFWIILIYLTLSLGAAATYHPIEDNLQHINIVYTFLKSGRLGCPMLSVNGSSVYYHYDRYIYAMPPGIYMLLALWFKLFSTGLMQLRTFGILFGAVGLLCWYHLFKKIGIENKKILIPAILLMSVDSVYTLYTFYRPFEPALITLLPLALISYLHYRETHLNRALFISHLLTAIACTIHPNALLLWIELTSIQLYLDFKRLRGSHLFYSLLPYTLLGIPILIYIFQDFETFKIQFLGNIAEEKPRQLFQKIVLALRSDFYLAYGGVSFKAKILLFVPTVYLTSIVMMVFRLRSQPYSRFLLVLLVIHLLFFLLITSSARNEYALFFVPIFSLSTAATLNYIRDQGVLGKALASSLFSLVLMLSVGARLSTVVKNELHKLYLPEMEAMKRKLNSTEPLFAPMETALVLGMENVLCDSSFGYFNGERRNIMIHTKSQKFTKYQPYPEQSAASEFIEEQLKESEIIFDGKIYRMYRRKIGR